MTCPSSCPWPRRVPHLRGFLISRCERFGSTHAGRGRAKATACGQVRVFRSLMTEAHERGWCESPKRLRRIKLPSPNPKAWTREEFSRILAECSVARGTVPHTRISRATYWTSFALAAYDTAFRVTDLKRLGPGDISSDGLCSIAMSKTGHVLCRELQPLTLEWIAKCLAEDPGRNLIWPATVERSAWARQFTKIVTRAGLTGSVKKIRKTAATQVEIERPGMARHLLGHRTDSMWRHYVDMAQVGAELPPPPPVSIGKVPKPKRKRPARYSAIDVLDSRRSDIQSWLATGVKLLHIAQRLDVAQGTLYALLRLRNVQRPAKQLPPGEKFGMEKLAQEDVRQTVLELLDAKLSKSRIAKHVGLDRHTLHKWLALNGHIEEKALRRKRRRRKRKETDDEQAS